MALVGDDEVEFLDGKIRVVFDRDGLFEQRALTPSPSPIQCIQWERVAGRPDEGLCDTVETFNWQIVEVRRGFFLALEHGVYALDRADDDAGGFVERVTGEMLDDVFSGELVIVHGRDELLEFLEGLPAEISAIHEEKDAAGTGVFDETINEVDCGVGLARTGRHLDERAPESGRERFLQAGDGLNLREPKRAGRQRWQLAEALSKLLLLLDPG